MYGDLNHPNKPLILGITHDYPDIFEKTLGNVKQIKLTNLNGFHFEPSNYGTFTLVKNN